MAERRNSLQPEPAVPRNNKRRRTMMDSVSEVARWLLPSWASEGSSDTPQDRYQQTTSGQHHQAAGSSLSNGERNPKRPRPNEVTRREPMGRLSPVASKAPSTTSTQIEADLDDGSDSSTSGCSSLSITAPAAVETVSAADTKSNTRRNRPIQNTKESKTRDVSISVDQTSIVAETSVTASPSLNFSLFSRPSRALSSTMNTSLPLTGSGASGTRSLSSSLHRPERSLNRSIFYEGKTTYGGAAAHRKLNLFSPSPYQMAAKRSKPASNVNVPETSSTAKRLIEALERMNTPVQNAKKIPLGRPENILTQSSEARRKEALESIASLRQSSVPPPLSSCRSSVQPARIGSNVKPVLPSSSSSDCPIDIDDADSAPLSNASNVPVITQTPRTVSATSLDNYDTDRTSSAGGKMKSAKSIQHHLSRKIPVEEEPPPTAPDLPSAPLPIKDLPSFSFQTAKVPSVSVASSQDCHKTSSTRSPLTSLADFSNKPFEKQQLPSPLACPTNDASEAFTFAAPIDLDKPTKTLYCKEAFDFKDPLYLKKDSPNRSSGFTVAAPTMISGGSFTLKTKTPEPSKIATAEVLSTGSVMDIIGKNDMRKDAPESAGQASNSSLRTNTWECPECRLQSPSGSCQNCASKKSSTSSATVGFATSTSTTTPSAPVANSWGNLFKKSSSSWDCSVCLVNNKSEALKCLACETPKPGSDSSKSDASATKSFGTAATSQWGDPFKKPVGESPKAAPAATGPSTPPSSTVKSPLSAMIKMAPGWSCDVCMIRNDLDKTKCVACETPKPGSGPAQESAPAPTATTSAFKFGVPKSDENKNITSEPATPIFGVNNSTANGGSDSSSVPNGGFKFGVPLAKPAGESTTGEQTNSTSKAPGSSGFSFGTPALTTAPALPQPTSSSTPAVAPSTVTATAASSTATNPVPTTTTSSTGFGGFAAAAASWGAKASSKTEAPPAAGAALFSFGPTSTASSTSTPAASTATAPKTFTFGATSNAPATPATQPSAATFSFGATTSAPTVPATTSAPTATFAFGGFGATPAKAPATGGLFGPGAAATSSVFGASTTVTTATSSQPTASAAFSFSSPASTGTAATPSVSATTTSQAASNSMFLFGNPSATASTTETQNSGSPFVFGTSSSSTGRLSGFSFGATAPTPTTTAATSAPTFTFGAAPAAATPLPTVSNGQNVFGSNTTPGFGVSNTTSTAPPPATNPVFQFNANLTPAGPGSSTPFTFSAGGTSTAATPSSGGLFAFGANTTNTTAPSSASNPTAVPGAAAPFQFGSAATAAAQTPAAAPAPGGMFNFGGAATATPATNFQFGGPPPGQGAAPFQFGNPAPALGGPAFPPTNADNPFDATLTQGRRMRRAVRRRGAR